MAGDILKYFAGPANQPSVAGASVTYNLSCHLLEGELLIYLFQHDAEVCPESCSCSCTCARPYVWVHACMACCTITQVYAYLRSPLGRARCMWSPYSAVFCIQFMSLSVKRLTLDVPIRISAVLIRCACSCRPVCGNRRRQVTPKAQSRKSIGAGDRV